MPRFVVLIPVSVASPKAPSATATLLSTRRVTDVGLPSPRLSLHFSAGGVAGAGASSRCPGLLC